MEDTNPNTISSSEVVLTSPSEEVALEKQRAVCAVSNRNIFIPIFIHMFNDFFVTNNCRQVDVTCHGSSVRATYELAHILRTDNVEEIRKRTAAGHDIDFFAFSSRELERGKYVRKTRKLMETLMDKTMIHSMLAEEYKQEIQPFKIGDYYLREIKSITSYDFTSDNPRFLMYFEKENPDDYEEKELVVDFHVFFDPHWICDFSVNSLIVTKNGVSIKNHHNENFIKIINDINMCQTRVFFDVETLVKKVNKGIARQSYIGEDIRAKIRELCKYAERLTKINETYYVRESPYLPIVKIMHDDPITAIDGKQPAFELKCGTDEHRHEISVNTLLSYANSDIPLKCPFCRENIQIKRYADYGRDYSELYYGQSSSMRMKTYKYVSTSSNYRQRHCAFSEKAYESFHQNMIPISESERLRRRSQENEELFRESEFASENE